MAKNYTNVIFNNNSSLDLNLFVAESISIPTPSLQSSNIDNSIRGREGLVSAKQVYSDIDIDVTFSYNINKINVTNIKKWLKNIEDNKLRINKDGEYFYKVKSIKMDNIVRDIAGNFKVTFSCEGLKYLDTSIDPIQIYNNTTIFNDGDGISNPVFLLRGNGIVTLRVNNVPVTINLSGNAIIDSNLNLCYREDKQLINQNMNGLFPRFKIGDNTIGWNGNVTECKLITNFRYL